MLRKYQHAAFFFLTLAGFVCALFRKPLFTLSTLCF